MNLPIMLMFFKVTKDFCSESEYHVISPYVKRKYDSEIYLQINYYSNFRNGIRIISGRTLKQYFVFTVNFKSSWSTMMPSFIFYMASNTVSCS